MASVVDVTAFDQGPGPMAAAPAPVARKAVTRKPIVPQTSTSTLNAQSNTSHPAPASSNVLHRRVSNATSVWSEISNPSSQNSPVQRHGSAANAAAQSPSQDLRICGFCKLDLPNPNGNHYECLACITTQRRTIFCDTCFIATAAPATHDHDRSNFISVSDALLHDAVYQAHGWGVRRTTTGRIWYHHSPTDTKTFNAPPIHIPITAPQSVPILAPQPRAAPVHLVQPESIQGTHQTQSTGSQQDQPIPPQNQERSYPTVQPRAAPGIQTQPMPAQAKIQTQPVQRPQATVIQPLPASPLPNLPKGWETIKDPDGRVFYMTKKTFPPTATWTRPKLADGWSELQTEKGRVYYSNNTLQKTSWEHPGFVIVAPGERPLTVAEAQRAALNSKLSQSSIPEYDSFSSTKSLSPKSERRKSSLMSPSSFSSASSAAMKGLRLQEGSKFREGSVSAGKELWQTTLQTGNVVGKGLKKAGKSKVGMALGMGLVSMALKETVGVGVPTSLKGAMLGGGSDDSGDDSDDSEDEEEEKEDSSSDDDSDNEGVGNDATGQYQENQNAISSGGNEQYTPISQGHSNNRNSMMAPMAAAVAAAAKSQSRNKGKKTAGAASGKKATNKDSTSDPTAKKKKKKKPGTKKATTGTAPAQQSQKDVGGPVPGPASNGTPNQPQAYGQQQVFNMVQGLPQGYQIVPGQMIYQPNISQGNIGLSQGSLVPDQNLPVQQNGQERSSGGLQMQPQTGNLPISQPPQQVYTHVAPQQHIHSQPQTMPHLYLGGQAQAQAQAQHLNLVPNDQGDHAFQVVQSQTGHPIQTRQVSAQSHVMAPTQSSLNHQVTSQPTVMNTSQVSYQPVHSQHNPPWHPPGAAHLQQQNHGTLLTHSQTHAHAHTHSQSTPSPYQLSPQQYPLEASQPQQVSQKHYSENSQTRAELEHQPYPNQQQSTQQSEQRSSKGFSVESQLADIPSQDSPYSAPHPSAQELPTNSRNAPVELPSNTQLSSQAQQGDSQISMEHQQPVDYLQRQTSSIQTYPSQFQAQPQAGPFPQQSQSITQTHSTSNGKNVIAVAGIGAAIGIAAAVMSRSSSSSSSDNERGKKSKKPIHKQTAIHPAGLHHHHQQHTSGHQQTAFGHAAQNSSQGPGNQQDQVSQPYIDNINSNNGNETYDQQPSMLQDISSTLSTNSNNTDTNQYPIQQGSSDQVTIVNVTTQENIVEVNNTTTDVNYDSASINNTSTNNPATIDTDGLTFASMNGPLPEYFDLGPQDEDELTPQSIASNPGWQQQGSNYQSPLQNYQQQDPTTEIPAQNYQQQQPVYQPPMQVDQQQNPTSQSLIQQEDPTSQPAQNYQQQDSDYLPQPFCDPSQEPQQQYSAQETLYPQPLFQQAQQQPIIPQNEYTPASALLPDPAPQQFVFDPTLAAPSIPPPAEQGGAIYDPTYLGPGASDPTAIPQYQSNYQQQDQNVYQQQYAGSDSVTQPSIYDPTLSGSTMTQLPIDQNGLQSNIGYSDTQGLANDIDGDGIQDQYDPDADGDGVINECDPDADGDGIVDEFEDEDDDDDDEEEEDDEDQEDGQPDYEGSGYGSLGNIFSTAGGGNSNEDWRSDPTAVLAYEGQAEVGELYALELI